MKDVSKSDLKRLERLLQIRQTYVSVAEAGVKAGEGEVRQLEAADTKAAQTIQDTRAEIAYRQTTTGHELQSGEEYIRALQDRRKVIQQSLENANSKLAERRSEWTEAMREEKI